MTRADEGEGREPELTQAKAIRDELYVYAAQLRKMKTQAGMGGRDLAVRVKEPDWLIRLMIRAASALEVRDRCGLAARAAQAEAEIARLKARLEIDHAYDGAGNRIPFPDGREHLDGIACRDETIKLVEAEVARLRERVATLEAALRPFANYAADMPGADFGEGEIGEYYHDGFRRSICTQDLRAARTALEAPHADN